MKALLIIDMLKGFCRKGYPLSLPDSTIGIEKYISLTIEETIKNHGKIIFVCDNHLFTDAEIGNPYPPHCMRDTIESEIINELKSYTESAVVLTKNTLSVFYNTELENILKEFNPTEIEITGVCTDICILFAIYELRIRGYNVIVSQNGVLPLDSNKQEEFLDYFEKRLGAKVTNRLIK